MYVRIQLAVKSGFNPEPEISFIRPEMLLRLMEILLSLVSFTFRSWSRIKLQSFFPPLIIPVSFLSLLFFFAKFAIYLFIFLFLFSILKYSLSKFLVSLFKYWVMNAVETRVLIRFYRINIYRTFSLDSLFPVLKKPWILYGYSSLVKLARTCACTYQ